MSRRLDISSLLCNDDVPEKVVLAPHLRNKSSAQSYPRTDPSPSTATITMSPGLFEPHFHRPPVRAPSPPSNPYPQLPYSHPSPRQLPPPPPPAQPKPFIGLDALVHAATEERRRLSTSTIPDSEVPVRPSPVDPPHVPQQFRQSRHVSSTDRVRSPAQQITIPRHSPGAVPLQAILSPVPPMRSPVYSPLVPHRRHVSHEESNIRLSPVEDPHRHQSPQQPPVYPLPYPSRHSLEQEKPVHQLELELQRQRHHHEQLLLQEQQQQQQLIRERHAYAERPPGPSMPLQLQETPPTHSVQTPALHVRGRKSDPGLLHRSVSIIHHDPPPPPMMQPPSYQQLHASQIVTHPPNKKRRYSNSPSRVTQDEDERLHHERERMAPGDIGFGRHDTSASSSVAVRREPNQVRGRGRIGLAELMSPNTEQDLSRPSSSIIESRRDIRELLSPVGRRSPPGSQIGRARAAKKFEEPQNSISDPPQPTRPHPQPLRESRIAQHADLEKGKLLDKEDGEKSSDKPSHPVPQAHSVTEIPQPKPKHPPQPVPRTQQPPPPSSTKVQDEEDAHEWFLEHFDESPATRSNPSPQRSPSAAPTSPPNSISPPAVPKSPVPKKKPSTPVLMPEEAAVALEQELEELVSTPLIPPTKVEQELDVDMEVDLAVTELVAETLEKDDCKVEDVAMEVDVEDELLSLVDDRPIARRAPGPSSLAPTNLKHPLLSESPMDDSEVISQPSPTETTPVAAVTRQPPNKVTPDRGSMPPPPPVPSGKAKDSEDRKGEKTAGINSSAPKKGKDEPKSTKSKTVSTPTTTASKPRAKGGPKAKQPKNLDGTTPPPATKSKTPALTGKKSASARSRSTSVMPGGSVGSEAGEVKPEKQEEEEASEEDDKLYCVCKTKYDEDKFMIACDKCDEWYHTQCVNMPDLEVDLVDQFICPPCIEKNPQLSLQTTYKTRCLFGLKHADPSSPDACHRPARGAFSKYCSDECGVKYMQSRVDVWARKGGKKDMLWETVKNAQKREGVVVPVSDPMVIARTESMDTGAEDDSKDKVLKSKKSKVDRDVERLNALLDSVVKLREEVKAGLENVVWRERLLELATERAEQVGQCGWDQRLCFGDQEWVEFGSGVLESYELANANNGEGKNDSPGDADGEWWCAGKKMCDRHAGWQTVRYRDVCNEKEKKEDALLNLTTREREIRKRIADILAPHGRTCNDSSTKSPLKSSNGKLNGHAKAKVNGDNAKKGKKRKAPA